MTLSIAAAPAVRSVPHVNVLSVNRTVYDAKNSSGMGTLVRKEGQDATGDSAADQAYDNAGVVYDFYSKLFGRDSIDGKGMIINSRVHYGRNYANAFWDGSKMTYGDGDGKILGPLSLGVDVAGHEMTHGVVEHTAGLNYRNQSGALNESWADVFGELIEQYKEHGGDLSGMQAAQGADWLIGEDVWTPGTAGDALRSMKAPGTAFKHVDVGGGQYIDDDQPANMKDYVNTYGDNGGVHTNSGIPNKAAYEVGMKLGSEKLARIWYGALTEYMKPTSDFQGAADATLAVAGTLYGDEGKQAVLDAWKAVGITAKDGARKATAAERSAGRADHLAGGMDAVNGFVPSYIANLI